MALELNYFMTTKSKGQIFSWRELNPEIFTWNLARHLYLPTHCSLCSVLSNVVMSLRQWHRRIYRRRRRRALELSWSKAQSAFDYITTLLTFVGRITIQRFLYIRGHLRIPHAFSKCFIKTAFNSALEI